MLFSIELFRPSIDLHVHVHVLMKVLPKDNVNTPMSMTFDILLHI